MVKPGGKILLLEHERSANLVIGAMMDLLNPLVVGLMGTNINWRTVENVQTLSTVTVASIGETTTFRYLLD